MIINLIGFPYHYGQRLDGATLAATHLRQNGLIEKLENVAVVKDLGNVSMPFEKQNKVFNNIKDAEANSAANYLISETISCLDPNDFILSIGGDHGMGLGTIHGILNLHPDSVIVWADAHGDINTPLTSPSGNFHGMPLAFLLHVAKDPRFSWIKNKLSQHKLILIGQRDLDQGEKEIIEQYGIQCFSSEELNRIGAKEILDMALNKADPLGVCPIHLSFDVDLFDGMDIPSTGTKVYHGPRLEEVFLLGGLLGETGRLKSMDIVEFNPNLGTFKEVQASTELIMDFIELTLKQSSEIRRPLSTHTNDLVSFR